MKKLLNIGILALLGSFSLEAYTHKVKFYEDPVQGLGTYTVTAYVVGLKPEVKSFTPKLEDQELQTFGAHCTDRIEVKVEGGKYDGSYINAPLPGFLHCKPWRLTIAKTEDLSGLHVFKSNNGRLALQVMPG